MPGPSTQRVERQHAGDGRRAPSMYTALCGCASELPRLDSAQSTGEIVRTLAALLLALALAGCAENNYPLADACKLLNDREFCKNVAELDGPTLKGVTLVGKGRYDEAIAEYDRSIALKPTARTYYLRGIAHRWKNENEAAIRDFDQAIAMKPDYADVYFSRGLSNFELGNLDTALDNYDEAIRINPRFVNAYNSRGHTHFTRKEWDLAVPEYKRAIEIDPTYSAGHQNLATTYVEMKEYKLAVAEYDRALQLAPGNVAIYGQRSLARFRGGDIGGALSDAEEFLARANSAKQEPGGLNLVGLKFRVQALRGMASIAKKDYATAIDMFSELIALAPQSQNMAPAYYLRAAAYRLSGDKKKADDDCSIALKLDPEIQGKMAEWLKVPI
ncbi:MAG TPA: tetratricopeptide repeat protein [Dongiaceae bacterium]|nr:tetratricopeptide repeat protein [Dongiaceae bacterium]